MNPRPVPYLGRTLAAREARGLRASVGLYPPCRQRLHVHERASFSVLLAGEGVERCRRQSDRPPPLTPVFNPTDEPHANDIGPGEVLGMTLEIGHDWLEEHGLTEKSLGGYRVVGPGVAPRQLCLRLLATLGRDGPRAPADVDTLALELLELLLRPTAGRAHDREPAWLARGEEFLRANFRSSSIGLGRAAREAGVHPIHFARVFRRRHGVPVSAYLRALRLTAAGELVLDGRQPLAEVACGAGFADQAHLTRWFSRAIGLSPGALRRFCRSAALRSAGPARRLRETCHAT